MLLPFQTLAEERIKKALDEGQLDDLPGQGRPQVFEDDSMVPPDLRMAYKILKNGGCLPPNVTSEKDIITAIDLLDSMEDEQQRYRQIRKLNWLMSDLNMRRGRNMALETDDEYYRMVVERVSTTFNK